MLTFYTILNVDILGITLTSQQLKNIVDLSYTV